jgi:hypothetical protein
MLDILSCNASRESNLVTISPGVPKARPTEVAPEARDLLRFPMRGFYQQKTAFGRTSVGRGFAPPGVTFEN